MIEEEIIIMLQVGFQKIFQGFDMSSHPVHILHNFKWSIYQIQMGFDTLCNELLDSR